VTCALDIRHEQAVVIIICRSALRIRSVAKIRIFLSALLISAAVTF
jgi:hypothetical protein